LSLPPSSVLNSVLSLSQASNLLSYFETIYTALRPGGIWINEGPLLYYNPAMELPLEDVIRIAKLVGFVMEKQEAKKGIKYTGDGLGAFSASRQRYKDTHLFFFYLFPPLSYSSNHRDVHVPPSFAPLSSTPR
jgi:hypothetical protein